MSRRRRNDAPAEPAPEQGVTLNLRNPAVLAAEWDIEARKSEESAQQDNEVADRLRAEAAEHQRQAGQAAEDEMRLMEALNEARTRREQHDAQKDLKLADAAKYAERAQFHEDRAADLRASIAGIQQAVPATSPMPEVDPTAEDPRINQSVANLMRIHDEDPAGEAGAA